MAGNTIGKILKLSTFGESHGSVMGGMIDGFPSGLELDLKAVQAELDRRKPGQSKLTSQRKETDQVEWLSGIFEGKSTGTPIGFMIANKDARSKDYSHIKDQFRPSHADFTYQEKYGLRDYRGGGRSSARETVCRVAAGALAAQFLRSEGIQVHSYVSAVGRLVVPHVPKDLSREKIDSNIVRCPDPEYADRFIEMIDTVRKEGDTLGGVITCIVRNVPTGLGEPVFNKLHASLGKAMLGINAVKGFEIGSGFEGSRMKGSEHNDAFVRGDEGIGTRSNFSGGIQGGISNGQDILMRIGFKPIATIMKDQQSVDKQGEEVTVKGKGRHDPCVVPRAVPIVDAMAALVLADFLLLKRTDRL